MPESKPVHMNRINFRGKSAKLAKMIAWSCENGCDLWYDEIDYSEGLGKTTGRTLPIDMQTARRFIEAYWNWRTITESTFTVYVDDGDLDMLILAFDSAIELNNP